MWPPTGLADGFGTEAIPTADYSADSPHYIVVPRLAVRRLSGGPPAHWGQRLPGGTGRKLT
ncbi:hypothetical protein L083_0551 [Actinoplanes sp. N902-109]|nr:hypothetical protein L083_0551 [Actinoplanes sp. N902-109]